MGPEVFLAAELQRPLFTLHPKPSPPASVDSLLSSRIQRQRDSCNYAVPPYLVIQALLSVGQDFNSTSAATALSLQHS